MITDLYPDGKNFVGEAKIMDTPYGKIVKNLIDEGAQLGVSSRGMGSLEPKKGAQYVRSDFYLALTIGVSLVAVFTYAGLFGTFVPLILNKYKIDPALATGPFITTTNDIIGLLIYFLIGMALYF